MDVFVVPDDMEALKRLIAPFKCGEFSCDAIVVPVSEHLTHIYVIGESTNFANDILSFAEERFEVSINRFPCAYTQFSLQGDYNSIKSKLKEIYKDYRFHIFANV